MSQKDLNPCKCCAMKALPCPFCGSMVAPMIGQNLIECSNFGCSATIDFGHWGGENNGIPAEHYIIEAWNKRIT